MPTESSHFLENVLLLPRLLRRVGLPASPQRSMDFARALALVDLQSREQVYFAARGLLVTRREHLDLFTTVFNRFWKAVTAGSLHGEAVTPRTRTRPRSVPVSILTLMGEKPGEHEEERDVFDRSATYSETEVLQQKAFAEMSEAELEAIHRLIREMRWDLTRRVTRRRVPDRRGDRLHLSRVLRAAAKHGGVPVQLAWRRRKIKQRPIVLIADMSGSMEKHSRLILQLFYSVSHSLRDIECFVFGTRLSRITPHLRIKNVDLAVDRAAREVFDWAGGTRIGESLCTFNRHWSRRVLGRGAVVIIVSDGWERGDVSVLRREMSALQRRCHRLIWLNPLLGGERYAPLVEGMTAAIPYVDDFLPIRNLQSLEALSEHLASVGRRPSGRRGTAYCAD
jgi:hypothetical protein